MDDSEPICETEQASFCVELMKRLNMQRGQGYLCDVTLVAKEGKEFKAHRNVLSAASPFFDKLLQSEMKEMKEGIIRFEEISASIMEDILEFIYTGSVEIRDDKNAIDLIIAADYLLLVCLKTISGRFLEQRLTTSNCISTLQFAEKYKCEELITKSTKFVHDNFAAVAELDEFLNLKAEEVQRWVSSDDIYLAAEEDVLKTIQRWVEQNKSERKVKFEELFRHVRLVLVSRDSLLDVVTNELVRENACCLRKVLDAIQVISCASEDTFTQSPRKRLESHAIVACGGKYTFCYLPETDSWKRLANGLSENRNHRTKIIKFRDQLYTFPESEAERYDPVFNGWASLQGLRLPSYRTKHVAVVRGQFYAIEVDRGTSNSTVIKRYDLELTSWQTIVSSHEVYRNESCVVSAGNCLYIFGGKASGEWSLQHVAKAERFDTVESKWEKIADMQQKRGSAFGVAAKGKIFVAGGFDRRQALKTCEVYNVSSDEWQFIGSLNNPRSWGSMVCVNGTLYVLGGSQGDSLRSELTVESYDPELNEWIQKTSIPESMIHEEQKPSFRGCTLKLSKGMLDKLK